MKTKAPLRRREVLLRLVLLALLLYSLLHYAAARQQLARTEAAAEILTKEHAELEREHETLEKRLAEGESAQALEARARTELGLVRPGEIIFYFSEDGEDG